MDYFSLSVPFKHKEIIKTLGCKWSAKFKMWQCPKNNKLENIKKIIQLQNNNTIGVKKKNHFKGIEDTDIYIKNHSEIKFFQNENTPSIICECLTEDEIMTIYNTFNKNDEDDDEDENDI